MVATLDELLAVSDIVTLHPPLTEETRAMIGRRELGLMRPGVTIINVARGALIDEAALMRTLQEGRLGGAALDVLETEPLPVESPLWKAPRLLLTPHISAISDRLWARQTELLVDLLERWFAGREMYNQVDLERGY